VARKALYGKRGACVELDVGLTKLDELCATRQLDARKIGKKVVITGESIDRYVEALRKAEIRIPANLRRRSEQAAP
jgi:hypothetical protein